MSPEAIIRAYESGRIVRDHAVSELCRIASGIPPATFADVVPDEFVEEIRTKTVRIPRPEELFILRSVCNAGPLGPVEEAAEERVEKEQYVEGLRAWKAYFESVA